MLASVARLLSVVFLLLLWSAAPHEGAAQQPWKTTSWQVACTHDLQDAIAEGRGRYERQVEEKLRERPEIAEQHFGGDIDRARQYIREVYEQLYEQGFEVCEPGQSDMLTALDEQLERASVWLQGLGFSGPRLEPEDEALEGHLFPASIIDCLTYYCAGVGYMSSSHGSYLPSEHLRLNMLVPNALYPVRQFSPRRVLDSRRALAAYTPVHEVFHAVQLGSNDGNQDFYWTSAGDWIWEGSARHVQHVAAQKWGTLVDPELERRPYDQPLHIPPSDGVFSSGREYQIATHRWKYGSWYFWDFLGEQTETADRVQYLDAILRQDLSAHNGLKGVHEALTMWNEDGLYDLYPEFVRQRLTDERYFSDDGFERLSLPWTGNREEGERDGTVDVVATRAYEVLVPVPEGERAGLKIEFAEDHDDLHLIVDEQRLDRANLQSEERNVFRTALEGQPDPHELFVRVANVAEDPPATRERSYTLAFTLEPLDPCSPEVMVAALNHEHFPAAGLFDPAADDPDEMRRPSEGRLAFGGLVSSSGEACTHHLSALDMTGAMMAGSVDEGEVEETMRARAEEMEQRLADMDLGDLRSMSPEDAQNLSPEQMQELMGMIDEFQDFMGPPEEDQADVVLNVYSPNALTWLSGSMPPPRTTQHAGLAGWPANSAAHVVIQLPGTSPAALEEGRTYPARAYAPPPDTGETPAMVPSLPGFYTWWEGTYEDIPYPAPQTPAEARRQEELKQQCRQQRQRARQVMRQMDEEGRAMLNQMLEMGDCSVRGVAFDGTTQVLTGTLTGEVTIEEITGAEVKGHLRLEGTGELYVEEWRFTYDEQTGVLDGDHTEQRERAGPITLEGTFSAPNLHEGLMRPVGYRSVVID